MPAQTESAIQTAARDPLATDDGSRPHSKRDLVALGVALVALVLFVGTGGTVIPQAIDAWRGLTDAPDRLLATATILNIAIILFGWRRYRTLRDELKDRTLSEAEARRAAQFDPLTGCYNRRSLAAAMTALHDRAEAEDRRVAVILVDLDSFKPINDIHGHAVGDHVLRQAAQRMRDSLPNGALLARIGGDEFACALVHDRAASHDVEKLAALLIEAVATPIAIGDLTIEVTMSVGIVGCRDLPPALESEEWPNEMMHKADIAMYHAKKHGKNRSCWFEPVMEQELKFRSQLENGIRAGIAACEFVPFYEQQVDIESGRLVGFEMLARWQSPALGLVGPDIFIPIAEEIGLIDELSECLLAQALKDAREWESSLTLSVNISPVQLRDPWFSQKLLKLLIQHNFPASRLEIEITESCLHDNIASVRAMITSLRNQGVAVSLDDFGTGYASLSQLRTLPFDRIKIDRSFIREINSEEASGKLVDAIVAMGAGLKMPITAEGIEDEAILTSLRSMSGLKGQGYFYGRPETASAVIERLREHGLLAERSTDTGGQPRMATGTA
ncbi:MAG: EAL domain-containing protein [Erythrobacter sp.]|nr:EAL domain-containing protein [Erythrobacter sp.]